MTTDETKLLKKLTKLRVDRSKGVAPHKPLLLLVFLELAKNGLITEPYVNLAPDLAFRFSVYWSIVAHRRSQPPDIRLPFHHISSDNFWTALTTDGTQSHHRNTTVRIILADDFFAALQSNDFREAAGYVLISNYFEHAEQVALYELAGIEPPVHRAALNDLAMQADKKPERKAVQRVSASMSLPLTATLAP